MAKGTIKCYATRSGRNAIVEWYAGQEGHVRAAFREFVEALAQQPFEDWGVPDVATLGGKWRVLHKFKIRTRDGQHRPLGFFGPDKAQYTILYPAREKDGKWNPRDARDQALTRRKDVMANPEQAVDYRFS